MKPKTGEKWRLPLAGLVLGAFASVLATGIVTIVIPTVMEAFRADAQQAQWVITIYNLTMGVAIPPCGWLMDRFGHKRVYLASLGLFSLGSVWCALAPSLNVLILARMIQAVGGGILSTATLALIHRIVPAERIGTAMGIWGVAVLSGPVAGPSFAGYLTDLGGWPTIFWFNLPFTLLAFLLGVRMLPSDGPRRQTEGFDLPGFTAITIGLFALQITVSQGNSAGWTSPLILGLAGLSAASLASFVRIELRREKPLLDLRTFRHPTFRSSALIIMILVAGMYSGLFYIPILSQNVLGLSPTMIGLVLLPGAVVSAVLQPISGRLYDRSGPRLLVAAGMFALAASNFLYARVSLETTPLTVALVNTLRSAGIALAYMPSVTAGISSVPTKEAGRVSSLSNIVQRVSTSLGLAALTAVFSARLSFHLPLRSSQPEAMVSALGDLFLLSGFIALIGIWPALALKAKSSSAKPGRTEERDHTIR